MWLLLVILYIILAIIFTQFYKIATKYTKKEGVLTVLLLWIAGGSALLLCPFFTITFPTDWKIYLFLGMACIFYAGAYRMNTTVRKGIEASTFSIINQLSTVFMIMAGIFFWKEQFVWKKIIGAGLIIGSNILIFYPKEKQKINKCVLLGILSNISFSIALFLDVNFSNNFNLAFYTTLTLLIPGFLIKFVERINLKQIKKELQKGNKPAIWITGISWGIVSVVQLRAYQLGDASTVAPLCALSVIGNVIIGYIFLKERENVFQKILAAFLIIIGLFLIKGGY